MLRVFPGFTQRLFPFLFHLPAQLFRLIAQLDGFPVRFLRQLAFLFRHLPVVFRVGNHVLKTDRVSAQQLPGRVNQVLRQSQPPADFKGVALSGNADGQTVCRPQCFHVKLHRGVFHALCGQCECLQLAVMRRCQRPHFDVQQPCQDALSQGRALSGIRSGTQFIKQHQVPGRHLMHNLHNVGHMTGEGRQALLNALLVSNVREYLLKHSQFRSRIRRYLQAGLRHQGKQTHRFQRYGLTAGIRAGNNQGGKLFPEPNGGRHHLFRINQRMPSADDLQVSFIIHLRTHAEKPAAQQPLGKDKVQLCQLFLRFRHCRGIGRHFSGQCRQDPGNLLLFLQFPLFQFIPHFHSGHGLDKQRRAGRTLIVNQSGYAGTEFRPYRQHIPVVSHGNDRILQRFLQRSGMDHLIQFFPDPVLGSPQMPPDVHQLAAGPVRNLILRDNRVRDISFNIPGNKKSFRLGPQDGSILPFCQQRILCRTARPQQFRHVQQHTGTQASAFLTDYQRRFHIRKRDHRMSAGVLQDYRCLFRLRLQRLHSGQFIRRFQHPALLRPCRCQRAFSQELTDPGKLQHPQCSFFHHSF